MATKIYEEITVETQAGRELVIRPLTIKSLRNFMEVMRGLDDGEEIDDERGIEVMLDAAKIAIKQCNPEIEDLDSLEAELDVPTINKILEVSGGIQVENPSLQTPTRQA